MRKASGLVFILAILAFCSYSQEKLSGSVRGVIVDTSGKQSLGDASVSVLGVIDSVQKAFTVTDKQGNFSIKNLPAGHYRLLISFLGYERVNRRFSIMPEKKDLDFGVLYIRKESQMLQEVVVERPAISVKKDTVEYAAGMYNTKPNALAEDLLKKLPGVQVDKNGTITAQGETVSRVLVNGKRFFSDDPKLATRNLPFR